MKNAPTSTWLYAIVRSAKPPAAALRGAKGIPGAKAPRLLDAGGELHLVVSSVPSAKWTAPVIEKNLHDMDWLGEVALAHESIVERFVKAPALLPAKLFTLFHDDARAIAHVTGDRRRITKILDRVAARVELGVRVSLDEAKALRRAESEAKKQARGSTGAGFLLRKKKVQEVARAGSEIARETAADVHDRLAGRAVDAVKKEITGTPDGGQSRLLLDAAYLVDVKRAQAFRKEAKTLARTAAKEGLALELTGPWPPYHFSAGDSP